jgi:hypothetical protein
VASECSFWSKTREVRQRLLSTLLSSRSAQTTDCLLHLLFESRTFALASEASDTNVCLVDRCHLSIRRRSLRRLVSYFWRKNLKSRVVCNMSFSISVHRLVEKARLCLMRMKLISLTSRTNLDQIRCCHFAPRSCSSSIDELEVFRHQELA